MKKNKLKKVLITIAIVLAALAVGGVVVGVLNALVADGEWSLGWSDYRYDETNYEIGEGSIPFTEITRIDVDWIDGEVEIVPCQDTYPSITEEADNELPDSAKLRWSVGEDGKTLSVKYRKSSWFFSLGSGSRNKKLILRIPERMLAQMTEIDVEVESASVTVTNVNVPKLEISTETGDVTLQMPSDASFVLDWETERGKLSSDFAFVQNGNRYTVGNGGNTVLVETERGDLLLAQKKP